MEATDRAKVTTLQRSRASRDQNGVVNGSREQLEGVFLSETRSSTVILETHSPCETAQADLMSFREALFGWANLDRVLAATPHKARGACVQG